MKNLTIKLEGYKETEIKFLHTYNGFKVFTGMVTKTRGKKEYYLTYAIKDGKATVRTVENLHNVNHELYEIKEIEVNNVISVSKPTKKPAKRNIVFMNNEQKRRYNERILGRKMQVFMKQKGWLRCKCNNTFHKGSITAHFYGNILVFSYGNQESVSTVHRLKVKTHKLH